MRNFFIEVKEVLKPNAHLILVFMPRATLLEGFYRAFKGDGKKYKKKKKSRL